MFFRKKNSEGGFSSQNLRRRFHHLILSKRKGITGKNVLPRKLPRRLVRNVRPSTVLLIQRLLVFFITAAIIFGTFYIVFLSSFFTINKITLEKKGNVVAGNSLAPFLDKFKGKNILFIRSDAFEKELEQTFRNEILLVRIKKSYPSRLIIKVEEYPAVANLRVFAGDAIQKMVVNQIGYAIFDNAEQKDLPIVILRTQKPLPKKSVVINAEMLSTLVFAFQKFTELFGIKIIDMEWKKTERELILRTEKNFTVWLDLTRNIEQQLNKLKRALNKLDIYREPLEYIDLRIASGWSEKVIYKKRK